MPNLLYVTPELLKKLKTHRAYQFWSPIIFAFPIRPIPLEERIFQPRKVKVEDDFLYLTSDMKFVYCRDGMCSFLYEDQDLSFRLAPSKGILQTVDGKQFTSVIGRVAKVVSTSDIELIDTEKCYHPLMDDGLASLPASASENSKPKKSAAAEAPKAKSKPKKETSAKKTTSAKKKKARSKDLILGKYEKSVCDELVKFRTSSKKSYKYLSERFGIPKAEVQEIIKIYAAKKRRGSSAGREAVAKVPKKTRDQIVRMKQVSKKSYSFLAKRFNLKIDVVKDICAQHLKRPRRR